MNIKVILNPKAGKGRAVHIWEMTNRLLKALSKKGFSGTGHHSLAPEHTRDLAGQADAEGYDAVMVIGGDGTVGDAAWGCLEHRLPLIVIPAGTGNACARSLGLSSKQDDLKQLLLQGEVSELDAGMIGNSFFINMAGIGFDADVLERYHHTGWARGIPGYIAVGLGMLRSYRPLSVTLTCDGHVHSSLAAMVGVCNGPYYGGGLQMAPHASMQDGRLDICVLENLSAADYITIWQKLYAGEHVRHPKVKLFQAEHMLIESESTLKYHRDGDLAGVTPCEVRVLPKALRVMTPRGWAHRSGRD